MEISMWNLAVLLLCAAYLVTASLAPFINRDRKRPIMGAWITPAFASVFCLIMLGMFVPKHAPHGAPLTAVLGLTAASIAFVAVVVLVAVRHLRLVHALGYVAVTALYVAALVTAEPSTIERIVVLTVLALALAVVVRVAPALVRTVILRDRSSGRHGRL